jgi:ferredoxin-NADP reductase
MRVIFDHSEHEAEHISTFYFRPERPFFYTAGQYIELTLKHDKPDERGEKRFFTLSSSPTDELLSITNKLRDKDGSSFKRALGRLRPGDALSMSAPQGDFVLPKHPGTPLTFIAGGIGITPFRSMLRWLNAIGERRPITLFYAVNHERDIVFQSVFDAAGHPTMIVVSSPSKGWRGRSGYLSADVILNTQKPSKDMLFYISGPEPMVKALHQDLQTAGIGKERLVLDLFLGYPSV